VLSTSVEVYLFKARSAVDKRPPRSRPGNRGSFTRFKKLNLLQSAVAKGDQPPACRAMEPGGFFGSMTQAPLPSRGSPSHARPTSLWGGATAEDQFQKSQGHQKRVPHKTSLDGGDTATMAAEADGEEYKRKAPMTSVWGGDAGAKGVCLLSNAGTPLSLSLSLSRGSTSCTHTHLPQ